MEEKNWEQEFHRLIEGIDMEDMVSDPRKGISAWQINRADHISWTGDDHHMAASIESADQGQMSGVRWTPIMCRLVLRTGFMSK